jgi:hypothetical protein
MRPFLVGLIVVVITSSRFLYLHDPALLHGWLQRLLLAN